MTKNVDIIPMPHTLCVKDGSLNLTSVSYVYDGFDEKQLSYCRSYFDTFLSCQGDNGITLRVVYLAELQGEAYQLNVDENGITVSAGTPEGVFRAAATLKQLVESDNQLSYVEISDKPDIKKRGLMLDISRGKIPTLDTLKELVRLMADLKYNELQLYMESLVFEYDNFIEYCRDNNPVTASELAELIAYCKERYIAVVPNQNCFGHMGKWLVHEEFNGLAIHDEGKPPYSLNPLNPDVLPFVDKIFGSLLHHFDSEYVNIGFDETVDLGKGETEEYCKQHGTGKLYLKYLLEVYELITKKYGKKVMFFDDIIFKHPELLPYVPKDCTLVQWGYESDHHYDRNCRALKECGLPFYVAPGTSSWRSLTGRNVNMLMNIHSAAENGVYYGADGFMLTDWGDSGHMQFPFVSYPAYAYGACVAWNCGSHDTETAYDERDNLIKLVFGYLDQFVFNATEKSVADIVWRLGNYYLLEQKPCFNNTKTVLMLYKGLNNIDVLAEEEPAVYKEVANYVSSIKAELGEFEKNTLTEEIALSCDMVCFHAKALIALIEKARGEEKRDNHHLSILAENIKSEFVRLWNVRNRPVGFNIYTDFITKVSEVMMS